MEIYVLNKVIEVWRKYNAVHEPLEKLNTMREVLGEQMNLRPYDINQHVVNTLRKHGEPSQYDYARQTICEIVMQCKDNDVICDIYRNLFDTLSKYEKDRKSSILVMNVTNKAAGADEKIQQLTLEADALQSEIKEHKEYIEKMKNRTWWQRLINKTDL